MEIINFIEKITKIIIYLLGVLMIISGIYQLYLYSQGKGLHYIKTKTKALLGTTRLRPIASYLSKSTAKKQDRRVLLIEALLCILFGILWLFFGREIFFNSTI